MVRELAEDHVPYLAELRGAQERWSGAMRQWFEGRVLCQEAKRYVSNFMVVTRARPQEEEHGGENSDDVKSDEELELRTEDLARALEKRIGGSQAARRTRGPGGGPRGGPGTARGLRHCGGHLAQARGRRRCHRGSGNRHGGRALEDDLREREGVA